MSSTVSTSETSTAIGGPPPPAPGRVSFRDLCCLFCCPPLPSSIVSKLAFMPPEPCYSITDDSRLNLIEGRAECPHEMFTTRTRRRNKVACLYVRPCGDAARYTLLFSHGNAVDLGQMSSFYYGLGYRLGCNVFSYDYSGYGCSTGKASEKNLYADIQAAFEALQTRYDIPAERVILYGQSIGTVPSVDLASKHPDVAALILHSPLMSGMRSLLCILEKVPRVTCPTLVIHGTDDEVIEFSHGVSIYERCPASVEPLWVAGAGHSDVGLHAAYLERLRLFIENEAGKKPATTQAYQPNGAIKSTRNNDSARTA
ncbi:unnamed protein product, partial [Mesorhabditis belari]|uniref:Serine aminopeptidase S33 domain-containing protein n=1 Tax=Mesorhabditis belari TaxID=2138241 RepID=A0AAF3FGW9_9BILA